MNNNAILISASNEGTIRFWDSVNSYQLLVAFLSSLSSEGKLKI